MPYEFKDAIRQTPALGPGIHVTSSGTISIDAPGFVAGATPEAQATSDSSRQDLATIRILTVVGSCTFGAADADRIFPPMLERRLQRRPMSSFDHQVVNGGIAGLDSDEGIGRLHYALEALPPDPATIHLG